MNQTVSLLQSGCCKFVTQWPRWWKYSITDARLPKQCSQCL